MVITFWGALGLILASMIFGFMIGLSLQYVIWRRKIISHYSVYASNIEALKSVFEQRSIQDLSELNERRITHLDAAAAN